MAATEAGEAHQLPGPEPVEAATNEDVRSMSADPITVTLGAPSPDVPTVSAQQEEEGDVIPVTGLSIQL